MENKTFWTRYEAYDDLKSSWWQMLYLFWYNRKKNTSMKACCLKQKDLTKIFKLFIHRGPLNKTLGKLITFLILSLEIDTQKKKTPPGGFIMC